METDKIMDDTNTISQVSLFVLFLGIIYFIENLNYF